MRSTSEEVWIGTRSGDIIKLEHMDSPQLAEWLEGKGEYLPDAETYQFLLKNKIIAIEEPDEFSGIKLIESVVDSPSKKLIYVFVSRDLNWETLNKIDQWAHNNRVAWMPLGITELGRIGIGPLVIPFESPCIKCLELRRSSHSSRWEVDLRLFGKQVDHPPLTESEYLLLTNLLKLRSSDMARFVKTMIGTVLSMDRSATTITEDRFLWIPKCPRCYPRWGEPKESWLPVSKSKIQDVKG